MNKNFIVIFLCFTLLCSRCRAQKDTLYKIYHNNGKIKAIGEKTNGLMQGEWKYYDDSLGFVKKTINYKDNFYHGIYKEFYENSKVKKIGYYDRYFIKEEIDDSGNIASFAIPIGSWDFYDENGNLIKTEVHDCNGKIVKILPEK